MPPADATSVNRGVTKGGEAAGDLRGATLPTAKAGFSEVSEEVREAPELGVSTLQPASSPTISPRLARSAIFPTEKKIRACNARPAGRMQGANQREPSMGRRIT